MRAIRSDAVKAMCRPSMKGPEMRCGKNVVWGDVVCLLLRQRRQGFLAGQLLHRVVAEERGEEDSTEGSAAISRP